MFCNKYFRFFLTLFCFSPLLIGPFSGYGFKLFAILALIFITKPHFKKSFIFYCSSFYLLCLTISAFLGKNIVFSFFGDENRNEGIITQYLFFGLFLFFTYAYRAEKKWDWLLKLILVVSFVLALASICQFLGFSKFFNDIGAGISSLLVNSGFYGLYLSLILFLNIFLLSKEKNKNCRIFESVCLALNFIFLILSLCRAGWIGFCAGLLWIFVGNIKTIWAYKEVFLISCLVGLVAVGTIVFSSDLVKSRLTEVIKTNVLETGLRAPAWREALKDFKNNIWFGVGPENFRWDTWNPYRSKEPLIFDRPHNKFIELLATTGILGTFAYFLLFFSLFLKLWKIKEKGTRLIFQGFLICFFIQNLFWFDLLYTLYLFYMVLFFIDSFDTRFGYNTIKE